MTDMRDHIAQRIRLLRVLKRRTIQQFADDLGVSRTAIYQWEATGGLSLDRLEEIAEHFGIPVSWFLPPKEPPHVDVDPGFVGTSFSRPVLAAVLRDWQAMFPG